MEVFLFCVIVIAVASADYDAEDQNHPQDIFNEANIDIPFYLDRPEQIPQYTEYGRNKLNCGLRISRCRPLIIYVVTVEDDIVDILTPKDNQDSNIEDVNIDTQFEPENNPLREAKPKNVKIVCLEAGNVDIDSLTDSLRSYKLSEKKRHHKYHIEDFIKYLHMLGVEAPKSLGRKGQGAPPFTIKQIFKKIKFISPTVHNNYQIIHNIPNKDDYEVVTLKPKEDDSLKIIPLSSSGSLNNNDQYETTEMNSLITNIYEDDETGKNFKTVEKKIYSEVVEVPQKEEKTINIENIQENPPEISTLEDDDPNKISELDLLDDDIEHYNDFPKIEETIIKEIKISPEYQTIEDSTLTRTDNSNDENEKDSNEIQPPQDKIEIVHESQTNHIHNETLRNTKLNSSPSDENNEPCNQKDKPIETNNEDLLRQNNIKLPQSDEADTKNIEKLLKENSKHISIPIDLKQLGIPNEGTQKVYLCFLNY